MCNETAGEIRVIKTRLDYVEKGIERNETALDKRLESMNEFRDSLKDNVYWNRDCHCPGDYT